jgi:gluconolactonase
MTSSRVVTGIAIAGAIVAVSRLGLQGRNPRAPDAVEQSQPAAAATAAPAANAAQQGPAVEIATTVAFTEGPAVDRDGNVYFTDIINQRILKLGADGMLSTYREPSNVANGLLIDPQGRLIACEGALFERPGVKRQGTPRVTRTDLKTGKSETIASGYEGKPFAGPNDVTIDGKGRLYFTDLPGAAVYRIDTSGTLARILAAPDVQRPNGIQVSPDDSTLYLIEANQAQGGARLIRAYDLQSDGTVRNMRVHYTFYPGRSADGMSIDSQGNLYASAGMNQLRGSSETLDTKTGVYVISPAGKLLKFIPIPEDFITNNAFGGADMKTLYVTAGKTLYKVRSDIAGLPR